MANQPICDKCTFYQKLLVDEEISLRSAEHWVTVFAVLMVLFGSAFFTMLVVWAME